MMNFLGQMRGICLSHLLKKKAGSNDGFDEEAARPKTSAR
jgi:hypothetical protein